MTTPTEALISQARSTFTGTDHQWEEVKASAQFVVTGGNEETAYGVSMELEDAVTLAANKEPYGAVKYADPGYQSDKQKRYPINTPEHIRAAWSYFAKPANSGKYTPEQRAKIKARIVSAWKAKIDKAGPPSA